MDHECTLIAILRMDLQRLRLLEIVRALHLSDCWIGAGFVRTAVWDHLAGRPARLAGDVDVIWFDQARSGRARDLALEQRLRRADPTVRWTVKNQSRMNERNGDDRYQSCTEALLGWPETATAIAARVTEEGRIEILAPFGLHDLFDGVVRPTPRFRTAKLDAFNCRWQEKAWLAQWPFLRVAVD